MLPTLRRFLFAIGPICLLFCSGIARGQQARPALRTQPPARTVESSFLFHPQAPSELPVPKQHPQLPTIEPNAAQAIRARAIERGRIAFNKSCTECHDADQALDESKSFQDWLVVIQEMSEKEDAKIPTASFIPIATYLAAQSPKASQNAQNKKTPLVESGRVSFFESCVTCHDAERSLSEKKSYREWMTTIRKMAAKEDADIYKDSFHPIAVFLVSRTDEEINLAADKTRMGNNTGEKEKSGLSPALVQAGEGAFRRSCVQCHDAERSLSVKQSFNEWMATIRRMAAKEDANIQATDHRSIASYLAARSPDEIEKAKAKAEADKNSDDDMEKDDGNEESGRKFDAALVAAGRTSFFSSCVKCHDADRSLSKKKGLTAWRSTVKRMAAKDGASVRPSDIEAIATFLASQSSGDGSASDDIADASPWAFSSTLSSLHRSSSDPIENPGFFVDAWVGADWQSDGPLRATVMACTSCHSDRNSSKGFTLELVEASATVDLKRLFSDWHAPSSQSSRNGMSSAPHGSETTPETTGISTSLRNSTESPISTSADLKMGRFVVPFGAFSSVSHPGSYRTVTNPLMYNMGRRITTGGVFQPVLPAPYSDEGVNFHFALREYCDRSYTLDLFAVNGLQGNAGGVNFNLSRSYTDNNRTPAVGGRFTLGNQIFRLGASGMTGRMQNDGSTPLDYHFVGADATINADRLRAYFEYAIRVDDLGNPTRNETDGYIVELEWKLRERLGLLARYDTLEHRLAAGHLSTERFTWGLNLTLPKAGLLVLNHEHWMLDDRTDVDVVGLRWVTTF